SYHLCICTNLHGTSGLTIGSDRTGGPTYSRCTSGARAHDDSAIVSFAIACGSSRERCTGGDGVNCNVSCGGTIGISDPGLYTKWQLQHGQNRGIRYRPVCDCGGYVSPGTASNRNSSECRLLL